MIKIEIRAKDTVEISGYVNAVERDSRVLPPEMSGGGIKTPFVERVRAGAFKRAINKSSDTEICLNHSKHLGARSEGNLEVYEDSVGLFARATIKDEEVVKAAQERKFTGWSFAFCNPVDSVEKINDNLSRRELRDFDLVEVSILTVTPAYIGTSVLEARSEKASVKECRSFEDEAEYGKEPEQPEEEKDDKAAVKRSLIRTELELIKLRGKEFEHES